MNCLDFFLKPNRAVPCKDNVLGKCLQEVVFEFKLCSHLSHSFLVLGLHLSNFVLLSLNVSLEQLSHLPRLVQLHAYQLGLVYRLLLLILKSPHIVSDLVQFSFVLSRREL